MYTLEKHLEEISKGNKHYESLNSIWKLNKERIPKIQDTIIYNFPHYSLHERSHSETILKNIEAFLGEGRIKQLSPTDTFFLIMSSFTHDLGMVVLNQDLATIFPTHEFQEYLDTLTLSRDKDLASASQLLLQIPNLNNKNQANLNLPLQIRKALVLVTADYFRRIHHERSRSILGGEDKNFNELASKFSLDQIPSRFSSILADIAYSHGISFYSMFDCLEYQSNGIGNDKFHPRFIACMLRLGDLLDIDDKRFNIFSNAVLDEKLPYISELHNKKHSSIKHLLIKPESIEITADCEDDGTFRIAMEWFDWLKDEVYNQSREWNSIVPLEIKGSSPSISRGKIKVLYKGNEPKKELMNLRFSISNEKVFEMFEGKALYDNAEFVFIRELVQNAIDASKIQLWHDVNSGAYNFLLCEKLNLDHDSSIKTITEKVVYPSDLPIEIWRNYIITLNIKWDEKKENLIIQIRDKGTGISENDLIRMTLNVGESRSKDKKYNEFKESMPFWLKPTGAFGIGLQSLFLVAENFKVSTQPLNEQAKEILFYSAKHGEYCRINNFIPSMDRGTEIEVLISKTSFDKVFGTSFPIQIFDHYDYFDNNIDDAHLYKLMNYIEEEFEQVHQLEINFCHQKIKKIRYTDSKKYVESIHKLSKQKDGVKCELLYNGYGSTRFRIFENVVADYGSEMELFFKNYFNSKVNYEFESANRSKYYVRDIPTKESIPSYYILMYTKLKWNLLSSASDKLLSLSRDKLISGKKQELGDMLINTIFPEVMHEVKDVFEEFYLKHPTLINESISNEYFHIELTSLFCGLQTNSHKEIYKGLTFPENLACNSDFMELDVIEFINSSCLYEFQIVGSEGKNFELKEVKNELEKIVKAYNLENPIFILNNTYFKFYLKARNYVITQYCFRNDLGKNCILTRYEKEYKVFKSLQLDDLSKRYYLQAVINNMSERMIAERVNLLAIEPYAPILSVSKRYDSFQQYMTINNYIVCPFKGINLVNEIKNDLQLYLREGNKDAISKEIKEKYFDKIINPKLISWVVNNSIQEIKPTEDDVKKAYLELITDMLTLNIQ